MARILVLTQVLPYPLDSGAKIRQYHMLRYLSQQHQVTLVSFVRPDNTPEQVAHLASFCAAVHTVPMRRSRWRDGRAALQGLLTGLPVVIARDEIGEMRALIRRLVTELRFAAVHADQISMAQYGLQAMRQGQLRGVIDMHNAMYLVLERLASGQRNPAKRLALRREARAMARYEARVCRAFDAVLTVTREDRDFLLQLYPQTERAAQAARFVPVPICVDPSQVSPVVHRPAPPTILHLGTMFWLPNSEGVLWFARDVLPRIWERAPEARFVVVGKDPLPEVRALAADPRIQVTGYVEDPAPYLEAADAFIVPLHAAGGMRVKILDAWLWGLPIVATPIGAEGIAVQDGENILIAGDAAGFAEAVLRLLGDPALNQRLRLNGRTWVEAKYAWQVVYQQVDRIYEYL
ncbi:MAG: glycosyltransferase [Chloroflexi bacterium]|nr:glycosyltransferase [Chloroflexota bacterium]